MLDELLWIVSWFMKQAGIWINKPENKNVAAILIACESTVQLRLDCFDCGFPQRFKEI